jgi:hypothetical protein
MEKLNKDFLPEETKLLEDIVKELGPLYPGSNIQIKQHDERRDDDPWAGISLEIGTKKLVFIDKSVGRYDISLKIGSDADAQAAGIIARHFSDYFKKNDTAKKLTGYD